MRIALVLTGVVLFFFVVLIRLAHIQLNPTKHVQVTTPKEYTRTIAPHRGTIYDRDGRPLAISIPGWRLFVDPGMIDEDKRDDVYRLLSQLKVSPPEKLHKAIYAKKGRYKPLDMIFSRELKNFIATNSLTSRCIGFEPLSRRTYPLERELCHVIGAVNRNEIPFIGLEQRYDFELRGKEGKIIGEADAHRQEIRSRRKEKIDAVNGHNLHLTIDSTIQYIVDQVMDETVAEFRPRSAWCIVQDTQTGEILAMASRPDFNPYDFGNEPVSNTWNRAVMHMYEPGSVMKSFAAAAALNEGLVHTNTIFDVSPGLYCGRSLSDHVPSNRIDLVTVLQKSSNRGSSRLGMMLGKKRQEEYLRSFGFGSKTKIGLPGEINGRLVESKRWSDLQNIRISIGQGISVTGIQLVNAYSCLANGGKLMRPQIIKEITTEDGTSLWHMQPMVVGTPIRPEVSEYMREMLRTVVGRGGTARRAVIPGYTAAGKTGTAQMVENGRYSDSNYCGSFCGFVPYDNPRLTILVTLEAPPRPRHHGGVCAAPAFAKIAEKALQHLQVPTNPGFVPKDEDFE